MDKKEILKERFKSAISSAVKVIADNSDIEICAGSYFDEAEWGYISFWSKYSEAHISLWLEIFNH